MLWLLPLVAIAGAAAVAAASSGDSSAQPFSHIRFVPIGGGKPEDAPALPSNASPADLDAAFAQAQARSEASRKASEDATRARLDEQTTQYGEALAFLGPAGVTAAIAYKALAMWGYDWAQKLAHFLYGDPGWNSPEQIARSKDEVTRFLAMGFAPRAFDPSIDAGAEGYADRLAEENTRMRGPEMPPQWSMFLDWVRSHPTDPVLRDAVWLGLFPMAFPPSRNQTAALARMMARAFGRDPSRAQAAGLAAWDAANAPGSEFRFSYAHARKFAFIFNSILAS